MRREPTGPESALWKRLRGRQIAGAKFRRQQPIGPYIADFICQSHRLIIEADGSQHADSEHDRRRLDWLTARGYRVLRFWNNEIIDNLDGVIEAIAALIDDASAPSPTSPCQQADKAQYPLPHGERKESAHNE